MKLANRLKMLITRGTPVFPRSIVPRGLNWLLRTRIEGGALPPVTLVAHGVNDLLEAGNVGSSNERGDSGVGDVSLGGVT